MAITRWFTVVLCYPNRRLSFLHHIPPLPPGGPHYDPNTRRKDSGGRGHCSMATGGTRDSNGELGVANS